GRPAAFSLLFPRIVEANLAEPDERLRVARLGHAPRLRDAIIDLAPQQPGDGGRAFAEEFLELTVADARAVDRPARAVDLDREGTAEGTDVGEASDVARPGLGFGDVVDRLAGHFRSVLRPVDADVAQQHQVADHEPREAEAEAHLCWFAIAADERKD